VHDNVASADASASMDIYSARTTVQSVLMSIGKDLRKMNSMNHLVTKMDKGLEKVLVIATANDVTTGGERNP
jgi:hypothetical protein